MNLFNLIWNYWFFFLFVKKLKLLLLHNRTIITNSTNNLATSNSYNQKKLHPTYLLVVTWTTWEKKSATLVPVQIRQRFSSVVIVIGRGWVAYPPYAEHYFRSTILNFLYLELYKLLVISEYELFGWEFIPNFGKYRMERFLANRLFVNIIVASFLLLSMCLI